MTREGFLRLSALVWLTAVWILLWGNLSIANVVSGLAVGVLIMVLMPLPGVPVQGRVHVLSLLRLGWKFVYYSLESSLQIAWLAVRPGPLPVTGVLRYQLGIKSDLVLTLFIDVLNLIPGTMVLEIDQARRIVYVHVLDMGSAKAVGQFYRTVAQLERLFVAAFERDSEWKPSAWHFGDEQYDDPAQEGTT
ncbi:Na+/H+ antiporter subunit E [Rhodococcus tibetensis]|uniref:Na+/H+ antiporter subunit E n=1 Tax=Rhodococcus tibetensis TaxID=2965064 RepID=A0ABT1QET5_9NOCA|nr:Na+/H+ antiporter subunit E [Rhodococcus sp. FXJ9.536]MCQ4120784.1 Na+/H+ antiporter subunit E [Rhodococcus sp. FXJ9.536]